MVMRNVCIIQRSRSSVSTFEQLNRTDEVLSLKDGHHSEIFVAMAQHPLTNQRSSLHCSSKIGSAIRHVDEK